MRVMGLDPGMGTTGWGVVDRVGSRLQYVACGCIETEKKDQVLSERLKFLYESLSEVIKLYAPDCCAIEDIFVNPNGRSTLVLAYARGVILLVPALHGIEVMPYAARIVKKAVTGYGAAEKGQVKKIVSLLLSGLDCKMKQDAWDALAVAVCHANQGLMTKEGR